ncbi:MAG: hypothetical protein KDG89_12260 [Geminicoccaceae bacterium]|nr:hypothetical protein [Geminicoccaceae bacterium]
METSLSRLVAGPADVRACLGRLRPVEPTDRHRRVEILVERGAEEAAHEVAKVYVRRGLTVVLVEIPKDFEGAKADLNDLLKHKGTEAVEAAVAAASPFTDEGEEDDRPIISLDGGTLDRATVKSLQAPTWLSLADPAKGVFQRGERLVHLHRPPVDPSQAQGKGALGIVDAGASYLKLRLSQAAIFQKTGRRSGPNPDTELVGALMASPQLWGGIPILKGIVHAPTLRADGSVLDRPGYDPPSGLFADFDGATFQPVPERPTPAEALAALARLRRVYSGFPFATPADEAVLLSALLTALVRPVLRSAPLFAFDAPKMASGKTLLATTVGCVVLGRAPAMMSQAEDPESERKRVLSLLLEGTPVVVIDNVERPLQSDALCSILTGQDRILGASRMVRVPTAATFMATGNNLVVAGDLTTRALVCRLDPGCERPEERRFSVNLYEAVPQWRGWMAADALMIVRAYLAAGAPDLGLPPYGRFEGWSARCRSPLVWLGMADPCVTRRRLEEADPVRDQLRTAMRAWRTVLGIGTCITARALVERLDKDYNDAALSLRDVLLEVAGEQGRIANRKAGRWLARHAGRIEEGTRFESAGTASGGVQLWRLVEVG